MWIFDKSIAMPALCLAVSVAHASDELVLHGSAKEKLSGTVTGIEESGVIVLASPLSNEPLRLKPNTVARVSFGNTSATQPKADMLVELANGDRLPVDVKSFTTEAGMRISSPAVGSLVLPPASLSALELGLPERRLVFDGPGDTAQWTSPLPNGFEKVSVEAKDWVVNGRLDASRQIEMPKNFAIRFRLEWEQRQQPNIKIYFAAPDANALTKADRYFLQFGNAGFEIKRESTTEKRFQTILVSNRRPDEFTGRRMDVMIQVNRVSKRVDLFLNDQLESWGIDPNPAAPVGAGIILGINGTDEATHSIRNLTVHELDNTRVRHRAEDRGNPEKDSLISRHEDRWTGDLREIRRNGDDVDFIFVIPSTKDPLEIPIEEVSTVFFRKPPEIAKDEPTKYRLLLRGEGMLSVKSCRISDDTITVVHPLLGELNLPKQTISRIEPTVNPDNQEDESE